MRMISVRIRGRAWQSTSSIACANFVREGLWRLPGGQAVARPPAGELLAPSLVELDLAHADRRRRDLHALVLAQPLQRHVEGELPMRDEPHQDVGGGRADVREVLLAHGVDV